MREERAGGTWDDRNWCTLSFIVRRGDLTTVTRCSLVPSLLTTTYDKDILICIIQGETETPRQRLSDLSRSLPIRCRSQTQIHSLSPVPGKRKQARSREPSWYGQGQARGKAASHARPCGHGLCLGSHPPSPTVSFPWPSSSVGVSGQLVFMSSMLLASWYLNSCIFVPFLETSEGGC